MEHSKGVTECVQTLAIVCTHTTRRADWCDALQIVTSSLGDGKLSDPESLKELQKMLSLVLKWMDLTTCVADMSHR